MQLTIIHFVIACIVLRIALKHSMSRETSCFTCRKAVLEELPYQFAAYLGALNKHCASIWIIVVQRLGMSVFKLLNLLVYNKTYAVLTTA